MKEEADSVTSSKIKQVYFPVGDGYHLLSILTPSGIVFQLRQRIDELRYSDVVKLLRERKKKNEFSETSYKEIWGLTEIGYGGTKPQNISVLNNQFAGRAVLLPSVPPPLSLNYRYFPKRNFFHESLRYGDYVQLFLELHAVFIAQPDGHMTRQELIIRRNNALQAIIDYLIDIVLEKREIARQFSSCEKSQLPPEQQIWLCVKAPENYPNIDWFSQIAQQITRWILSTYQSVNGKNALSLGHEERRFIGSYAEVNKELLIP